MCFSFKLKQYFKTGLITTLLLLGSCGQPRYLLSNGQGIEIPDPKGWTLVNYWAPWCAPCLKEIPEINKMFEEMPQPLVGIVGIYFDSATKEQLKVQLEKYQINFPTLSVTSATEPVDRPSMLPANYLISPNGDIFGPLLGPQTQQSILSAIDHFQHPIN